MWEIRQAIVVDVTYVQDQRGVWAGSVVTMGYPGGQERTLFSGESYSFSWLSRELFETIERFIYGCQAEIEKASAMEEAET